MIPDPDSIYACRDCGCEYVHIHGLNTKRLCTECLERVKDEDADYRFELMRDER
jgi:hypothetical protein